MSDQKPGCIHPGDPQGCIGIFVIVTAALATGIAVAKLAVNFCPGRADP